MTKTAKLLADGRGQTVLLPEEFRFNANEVRISKVGDKVILEPIKRIPADFDFDKFWARLDALGARDYLPDGIPDGLPTEPSTRDPHR
jgi:antitoxin VapB